MRLTITVDGSEVQWLKRSLRLTSRMGDRISTVVFDMLGDRRLASPSYAIARVPAIGGLLAPRDKAEVTIDRTETPLINCAIAPVVAMGGNSAWISHFFGGYISSIDHRTIGSRRIYRITAQDYNVLTTQILATEAYAAKTQQFIIDDLFTTYLPEIDTTTYVESDATAVTINWTRYFLDKALDELATIMEKKWYIDHDKKLHYFAPVTTAAPFTLSSTPFGTVNIGYDGFQFIEDNAKIINRVTVVGDGVTRTRTDATSYAKYGRYYEGKVVDNNVDTNAWADLVGDAVLAESAFGKVRGRLTCHQEGLVIGQKVSIYNFRRSVDDFYLIQAIRLGMVNVDTERVDVEYGDYSPNLIDLLLKIKKEEEKE